MNAGDSLTAKDPRDALKEFSSGAKDACQDYYAYRTVNVYVQNETPAVARIWFYQVKDTSGSVPPGFTADTGVVVGAANGAAHSTYNVDPCRNNRPIQGTLFSGSIKLVYGGNEYDYALGDIATDPGTYAGTAGWRITIGNSPKGLAGPPNFIIQPIR